MQTIFISFSIRNSSVTDYFVELVNRLALNFKVVVIADVNLPHSFEIESEVTIYSFPKANFIHPKNILFVYNKLRRYKPAMIISNFRSVNLFIPLGYLLGVKHRIAWCHSISEQFLPQRPFFDRKKYIYNMATAIIANSYATKTDLIENYGLKAAKIEVFYNALRKNNLKRAKVNQYQIVYVGRMHPSKGVDVLLKAMPEIIGSFPKINLKLIGGKIKGNEIHNYKILAEELEISKNVEFSGFRPKEDVIREFSESYLTVVPSLVEAFGYVVIESFSVGTPVIGSNTSGIAEIIRDNKDGFLFEAQKSKDLAGKILKLLGDKKLRNQFSENCFNRFSSDFEIKSTINELSGRFEELLNN